MNKYRYGTFLAALLILGCSSPTTKNAANDTAPRKPAANEDFSYPLNSRFEKALPNEDQDVAMIRAGILETQQKEFNAHGKYLRGTHSKGTCVGGEMKIYDVEKSAPAAIAGRLKKGIFSGAGSYPVDVRFANAAGSVNPDHQRDVRAVSFSIHMPPALSNPQGQMDFAMNNATTFPINNAQVFADLFRLGDGGAKSAKELGFWRDRDVAGAIVRGKGVQEQPGKTPYQLMRYWSTVPFALGDDEAVKYSLKPCRSNHAESLNASDPDELKNELIRHVNNDEKMSCFEFEVQLLDAHKMTHDGRKESESWWVENAAVEWHESEAPFYPVGMLTLAPKSVVADPICEKRWINVLANNNEIHRGLGSINRARTAAESASAVKRLE